MKPGLPARGERVEILWPEADFTFVLNVRTAESHPGGWVLLTGELVEPYRDWREFYVRPTDDGGWSLAPKLLR